MEMVQVLREAWVKVGVGLIGYSFFFISEYHFVTRVDVFSYCGGRCKIVLLAPALTMTALLC